MKNVDSKACQTLAGKAANFMQNGTNTSVCNSLKNDTGFNSSNSRTNCDDLDDAADCLIGMMESELSCYDICDWKDFMRAFVPNLHQMIKAMVCDACGQWLAIHDLEDVSERIDCLIAFMMSGQNFSIGESVSGDAYAVAGKGVSFLTVSSGQTHTTDLYLRYIGGGFVLGGGSYKFYLDDFNEPNSQTVGNFDNASTGDNRGYRTSNARKANAFWGTLTSDEDSFPDGGELICEFRLKKSAFPQIRNLYNGVGQETGGGSYHVRTAYFDGDDDGTVYAYGQHGWCDDDGTPSKDGYDYGHVVPEGWYYIQLRMTSCDKLGIKRQANYPDNYGSKYSPRFYMGMRMNQNKIDC